MRTAQFWLRRVPALVQVIFHIKIPESLHRVACACVDTSDYCVFRREQRLVFPLHSLFRVDDAQENGKLWKIDLTLVDENDDDILRIVNSLALVVGLNSFFTDSVNKRIFLQDLSEENGAFVRFQLLVDMILRLDHNGFSKQEMIEMCRAEYENNPTALQQIKSLEQTYESKEAVKWYTKNSFLYRLLNRSLRDSNINLIVKLRHFIYDLHNQLVELQNDFLRSLQTKSSILTLYRGLSMSEEEFEQFRQHENHYVSMNGFLSSTHDYQAALFFAGEGKMEDSRVSVIYEISVDLTLKHSIPFAAIDYESVFTDEDEVLFSIGAVFRIRTIESIGEQIWKIHLTLTPPTEGQWSSLTQHLRESRS